MKTVRALAFLLLLAAPAMAQDTFHVFPQIADGVAPDGSYYRSTFRILPWFDTDSPDCTLRTYGINITLNGSTGSVFNIEIPVGGYSASTTTANQALRAGYATITCTDYVFAEVLYSFYSASGVKVGEATVFSSPEIFHQSRLIFDKRDGAQLGIAVANNTDVPHTYTLALGGRSSTFSIAARSSTALFVPASLADGVASTGILTITANDLSAFYAIGLRFTGPVFTTIPAN